MHWPPANSVMISFSFHFFRVTLPAPQFTKFEFNLWSVLKNCIGKELSKITMPVVFNEPLSFLQRMTEYMEYARLLQLAAENDNPIERMKYVAGTCSDALCIPRLALAILLRADPLTPSMHCACRLCHIGAGIELGAIGQTVQSDSRRDIRIPKLRFSDSVRAGVAPSTDIRVPCRLAGIQIFRRHSSKAQVLGQKCRDSAQGHRHRRTACMEWGLYLVECQLLRAQHYRGQNVDRTIWHHGDREQDQRHSGPADIQARWYFIEGFASCRGHHLR